MLLENELEELSHWFESQYPGGTFSGHAGYNQKDMSEEYHISFMLEGEHFSSSFTIPPGALDQPREFIDKFRKDFVNIQKRKIAAAALGLVYH